MTFDKNISNPKRIARRLFLKNLVSATTIAPVASRLLVAGTEATHPRVTREVFVKSPGKGTAVMAFAYYTRPKGTEMMSIEQRWSRSDTIDVAYYRYSKDNGRTWTDPEKRITGEKRPGGMWRLHPRGGFVDSHTGRFLEIWNEGILPSDDPLEGMRQWNVYYTVSKRRQNEIGCPADHSRRT